LPAKPPQLEQVRERDGRISENAIDNFRFEPFRSRIVGISRRLP
jgi:hypothetical protein